MGRQKRSKAIRKFSGKNYSRVYAVATKAEAKKSAKIWRAQGWNVRIVKVPKSIDPYEIIPYDVYVRKREKSRRRK